MKLIYLIFLMGILMFLSSCSEDDDTSPINDDEETTLVGSYHGVSFSASVANGLVDGGLSGSLNLNGDGNYSSTISPFSLNEAEGVWSYYEDESRLFFNEGETTEEIAENLVLTDDSLFFTIYRGEPTNQTVIDFKFVKQ